MPARNIVGELGKKIRWQVRLGGVCLHIEIQCAVRASVDGRDVLICEPFPFDSKWWSHKLKHPVLGF